MKTALLLAALLLAGTAQSQTVWRCGPDGRNYSAVPCAEGRIVAVADPRSAADVAAGRDVARRETALASQLALQRREREQEAMLQRRFAPHSTEPAPKSSKPVVATRKAPKRLRQQEEAELTPSRTATGGTSSAVAPASRRKTG